MKGCLIIDGKQVPFDKGQTVMDAALAAGIDIPHLCHHPEFSPHGSCRVCSVRMNGRTVAACITPATDGARIENETSAVNEMRKALIQMLFVEGNHVCPACVVSGACQLQAAAYQVGMLEPRFPHFYPKRSIDASHDHFIIDYNRCIQCELCSRASRDIDGKSLFSISGRGLEATLVVNSTSGKLGDTAFKSTDRAASVCPVGAILPKHRSFEVPIGERIHDSHVIDECEEGTREKGESNAS